MTEHDKKIRTRYAPSPTGDPHIGNIRTALFEYLFARSQGGEFLLRIEDTDRERYVDGSVERIIESLRWLGISPDNVDNFPKQSNRLEIYKKHAFDLVRAGHAYICTCSKEKLAADSERQKKEGKPPRYEGHCRTAEFNLKDLKEGCYVIRMKMPEDRKVVINDLIKGKVEFNTSLLDDQIILKSDGFPTYHLAVVVDDTEMGITHVIRGDEWLSSTPKHLLLYEYFGWQPPQYVHLPVILGSDKKKLSKRHGATSLMGYKELGYLPEAIINFLALLGWNPKDNREEFTIAELEKEFKIENINKAPAVFDIEKLNNINSQKIKDQISKIKITDQKSKYLESFGIDDLTSGELELIGRGGYKTLIEAADYIKKLRAGVDYKADLLIFRKSDKERTRVGLQNAISKMRDVESWENDKIQEVLMQVVTENKLTNGDVFWSVRVALSGEEKSPSPVELAVALGKKETLKRIDKAIEKLA